jgi:hypothetical protein
MLHEIDPRALFKIEPARPASKSRQALAPRPAAIHHEGTNNCNVPADGIKLFPGFGDAIDAIAPTV